MSDTLTRPVSVRRMILDTAEKETVSAQQQMKNQIAHEADCVDAARRRYPESVKGMFFQQLRLRFHLYYTQEDADRMVVTVNSADTSFTPETAIRTTGDDITFIGYVHHGGELAIYPVKKCSKCGCEVMPLYPPQTIMEVATFLEDDRLPLFHLCASL